MSEFDKALDKRYGKGFSKSLKCKEHGVELCICPCCGEAVCPECLKEA
jgi:hypothetical protein